MSVYEFLSTVVLLNIHSTSNLKKYIKIKSINKLLIYFYTKHFKVEILTIIKFECGSIYEFINIVNLVNFIRNLRKMYKLRVFNFESCSNYISKDNLFFNVF